MAKDFLLEIGLEEMPAHVVTSSMDQLAEKIEKFLNEQALSYEKLSAFSTPRRLGIQIENLAEKQQDVEEEVKGPAKKIALDSDGNWSKAALGFVKGQGATTADITFKEIKGTEYVYVKKFIPGKRANEVLTGLKEVVRSLTFPISMHWASYDFKYIRPVHWMVALLDEEVIPFDILDIQTGRETRGHRFLGSPVILKRAAEYQKKMAEQFVITDPQARKNSIRSQAKETAKKNHYQIMIDEDLLEEVNNLVEYPTLFVGEFNKKYLSIPDEVLVTSMKDHQRYFEVRSLSGELLPFFASVRNGDAVYLENVVKGNQKVLTARLEDAEFFYQEDQKISIDTYVEKLKKVTFHEKIGTMYEKMMRVSFISEMLGKKVGLTEQESIDLKRASQIYKFDLVTGMVGEFPELQGIMGEKYALIQGENDAVAQAIREHYLPISSEGKLPVSDIGSVLAVADKLDSVFCFFAVGMIPSGSNDPYALRRQTYGVIRIIEQKGWAFPLADIQVKVDAVINDNQKKYGIALESGQQEVLNFVNGRLKQYLTSKSVRHDIIDAVVNSEEQDLTALFDSAEVLKNHLNDNDFKETIEAITRVMNLAKKGKELQIIDRGIDPDLFENEAETKLYQEVEKIEDHFFEHSTEENFTALKELRPYIEAYFEATMVMTEDEAVRNNRVNQLRKITKMALTIGSLDQLVVK